MVLHMAIQVCPNNFTEKKIANQLSDDKIDFWLADCFEFVELAVNHSYKRLGVASKLHDELLANTNCGTAVLTTAIKNKPALNLYKKKGWEVIKKRMHPLFQRITFR